MTNFRRWFHRFAVRGIVWRRYLDFGLTNVPFYLRPVMIFFWTILFFFLAAPARRAILSNLRVVRLGSSLLNLDGPAHTLALPGRFPMRGLQTKDRVRL
jgi:hypothetical protein